MWPGTLNLGSLQVNTSTSAPVYFTNTSAVVPVAINSTTIALFSAVGSVSDFSIALCGAIPSQVAVEATCNFTVNFKPSVVGTETPTITVADRSASSPHTITVSGIGLAATQVPEFTPGSQVFVDQPLRYQSASETFSVYNTGNAPVIVDRTLVSGDFQIISDSCTGQTLAPPTTPGLITAPQSNVSVAFTPTALGHDQGRLR